MFGTLAIRQIGIYQIETNLYGSSFYLDIDEGYNSDLIAAQYEVVMHPNGMEKIYLEYYDSPVNLEGFSPINGIFPNIDDEIIAGHSYFCGI